MLKCTVPSAGQEKVHLLIYVRFKFTFYPHLFGSLDPCGVYDEAMMRVPRAVFILCEEVKYPHDSKPKGTEGSTMKVKFPTLPQKTAPSIEANAISIS